MYMRPISRIRKSNADQPFLHQPPDRCQPTPSPVSGPSEPWRAADLVRVTRQVAHLHALGPRLLLELLIELGADPFVRDDLDLLLPHYCRLDLNTVEALDARRLRLPIVVIEDGGIREVPA